MRQTDRQDDVDSDLGSGLLGSMERRERGLLLRIRTGSPSTVVAYDAATQTVTCTVDSLVVEPGPALAPGVQGPDVPLPPIQLLGIPVDFQRGMGGAAYDTIPILPGDTGRLVVLDRAMDEWRKRGVPCDPIDGRTHSLADCVFVPGLHPDTDPIVPPTSLAARVIEAPLIHVGAGATLVEGAAVLGPALVEAFTAFTTALTTVGGVWNTATGAPTPAGPGIPAAATPAINGAYIFGLIAANTALVATLASWLSGKVAIER